ncbi:MAG TPA: hypothetical protein VK524_12535, partial [Polyangiaceae bacterium]|nr:hypothetical protein [Polyangiaceae bacterium]
ENAGPERPEPALAVASTSPADEVASESSEPDSALPTSCSRSEGPCTPARKWVERLCAGSFPSAALRLFGKGSPWTRGYLTRKTGAWNAAGGASEPVQLEFDEEVIVLLERTPNASGIQVSGAGGGYEALRWDGGCVTLAKEELTLKRPPQPLAAKVEWRFLDPATRDALSLDETVKQAYQDRRNECKGASSGTVSLKCVKADTKLSQVIVDYVRNGGELGQLQKMP